MVSTNNIKTTNPRGFDAQAITLSGVSEVQYLYVPPRATIERHTHKDYWEVVIHLAEKKVYVALKNEEHEIINESGHMLVLMIIRGRRKYSFNHFEDFSKISTFPCIMNP